MDPKKFLALAELLANENPSLPEKLRSATSRAYYAAYHVSVEALNSLGIHISASSNGHGELVKYLGGSQDNELAVISSALGTLQTSRNNADYHLNDARAENPKNVKMHIEQAKKIIETVKRCCSGPNRPRIIEAMKKFESIMKGRPLPPK